VVPRTLDNFVLLTIPRQAGSLIYDKMPEVATYPFFRHILIIIRLIGIHCFIQFTFFVLQLFNNKRYVLPLISHVLRCCGATCLNVWLLNFFINIFIPGAASIFIKGF
jgi:hypothetical protein